MKSIGLHVFKKAVISHKKAEIFENQRLHHFMTDFGIEIKNGQGINCRNNKKSNIDMEIASILKLNELNQAELTDLCKNTSYKFKKKGEKIC